MPTWSVSVPAKTMNGEKEIVDFFRAKGVLVQPEAVEYFLQSGKDIPLLNHVLDELKEKPFIVSLETMHQLVGQNGDVPQTPNQRMPILFDGECVRKKQSVHIKLDVTGNSTCNGSLHDFVSLFRDRFARLGTMMRRRQSMSNTIPIRKAMSILDEEITLIGMVREISVVKNGIIAELEDEEASISIYIPKDIDPLMIVDEVVGITGKRRGDFIVATSVTRPDVPMHLPHHHTEDEIYVVFISDLHIGSKSFLSNEWDSFIEWVRGERGNEQHQHIAKKVAYLVICGDVAEGIGIYPGQEEDLLIEDIYAQYEELAKKLATIPSDITIIMQPGNHDMVRPSLPQPAFEKEVRDVFSCRDITFIGNPCHIEIEGVPILAYHGQSIQDFSTYLPDMNQNNPTKIMKEMIRRRHMAPIYGGITSLAPEKRDYMVIDPIPDIFVTGHVHVTSVEPYRGILLINASAWQSQTEYQRMMDFTPDPAKAVAVDLQTMAPTVLQFS